VQEPLLVSKVKATQDSREAQNAAHFCGSEYFFDVLTVAILPDRAIFSLVSKSKVAADKGCNAKTNKKAKGEILIMFCTYMLKNYNYMFAVHT
tara:strand:- start:158 stop:436 length:279 start_codon:yes stop_codon:yes gene_type:complete